MFIPARLSNSLTLFYINRPITLGNKQPCSMICCVFSLKAYFAEKWSINHGNDARLKVAATMWVLTWIIIGASIVWSLWITAAAVYPTYFKSKESCTLTTREIYAFCIILTKTTIYFLKRNNFLLIKVRCVYCEIGSEYMYYLLHTFVSWGQVL